MKKARIFLLLTIVLSSGLFAQSMPREDAIDFFENGKLLVSKYAGGLEMPQFSEVDLNGDNFMDLFIFDRTRAEGKILTFINGGTPNTVDYVYAPQYEAQYPSGMENLGLLRDFNCDGELDIFTYHLEKFRVYEWTPSGYVLFTDSLTSNYGGGQLGIPLPSEDVPAIVDVDGDGYVDILNFDPSGTFLEYHRNVTFDSTGGCSQFILNREDACWGKFSESGIGNTISTNISCRVAPWSGEIPGTQGEHGGSTVGAFDEDGDGDLDIFLGDLFFPDLVFLRNGGDSVNALIDSVDYFFPSYDTPASINMFPGAYFFDANNDGLTDIAASPSLRSISYSYDNSWLYENAGNSTQANFNHTNTAFLQDEMVDVGQASFPVFFDQNNDGLLDLVIGNDRFTSPTVPETSTLTLYRNTGTANNPEFTLVTRNYVDIPAQFNPTISGLAPAFADMDGDGDEDMILGEFNGGLHYFENTGLPGDTAIFALTTANYKGINVGILTTPTIADINRDGKPDLIVGELDGTLNYFENTGTVTVADFASSPTTTNWGNVDTEPQCCQGYAAPFVFERNGKWALVVGTEKGKIYYYDDIESHLGGSFPITDSSFGEIWNGLQASVACADIDGDNQYEFVAGNLRGGISVYGSSIIASKKHEKASAFRLYPNPSGGFAVLGLPEWARGRDFELQVFDAGGKIIEAAAGQITEAEWRIGRADLAAGLYFVTVRIDGMPLQSRKWVVTE